MVNILTILFAVALPAYLVRFSVGPLPTTLLEALWVAMIVAWLMRRSKSVGAENFLPLRPWLLPCGLLVVAGIVGVAISPDTRAALGLFKAYLVEPVIFFLMFQTVADDALRRKMLTALIVSGAAIAAAALLQPLVAPQTLWEGTRATAFYPFPNAVGLFLGPIAVLVVGAGLSRPGRDDRAPTWVFLAAAILMVAAIVAAQSEGAIVGVAAGLVTFGLLHKKTRRATVVAAVILAVVIALIPVTRNLAAEKLTLRDWSGTVRRITWGETVEMLSDRPLTGAGLAGYPIVMRDYHKATAIEIFQYPHQIVLNIWSELGLLGLIAFSWILMTFFRLAGRDESRPYGRIAIAAMVALLVHGLVDVPYFKNDLAFLFWIIVALGTAVSLPNPQKRLS